MLKTDIAVLVSGGGTNLQAILDAEKSGVLHSGEIVLVVSNNPDAYALTRAANHGVKAAVADHRGRTQVEFEAELQRLLEENGIKLIVLAGFLRILTPEFTARWRDRIINVHPSLIPSFCGAGFYGLKVHEAALRRGVKISGATVHLVNEIPDGGRILLQKAVAVEPDDTPETLQRRIMEEAEWVLLPEAAELMSKQIMEEEQK